MQLGAPLSPPPDYLVFLVQRLPPSANAALLREPMQVAMAAVGLEETQARVGRAAARAEMDVSRKQLDFEVGSAVRVPFHGACRLSKRPLDEARPSGAEAALLEGHTHGSAGATGTGLMDAAGDGTGSGTEVLGQHAVPWSRSGRGPPLHREAMERSRDGEEPETAFGEASRRSLLQAMEEQDAAVASAQKSRGRWGAAGQLQAPAPGPLPAYLQDGADLVASMLKPGEQAQRDGDLRRGPGVLVFWGPRGRKQVQRRRNGGGRWRLGAGGKGRGGARARGGRAGAPDQGAGRPVRGRTESSGERSLMGGAAGGALGRSRSDSRASAVSDADFGSGSVHGDGGSRRGKGKGRRWGSRSRRGSVAGRSRAGSIASSTGGFGGMDDGASSVGGGGRERSESDASLQSALLGGADYDGRGRSAGRRSNASGETRGSAGPWGRSGRGLEAEDHDELADGELEAWMTLVYWPDRRPAV